MSDDTPRSPELTVERVAFTTIPSRDIPRARAFYEGVLGLPVGMAGGRGDIHWIEYDLPGGGCVALTNATQHEPSRGAGAMLALEVRNLDALLEHLKASDVEIAGDVIKGPRCRMCVCHDPEGNAILLHQLDATS